MEKRKIDFFIANPAGNITAFVTSKTTREDYQVIAQKLFEMDEYKIEQVGFIKEKPEDADGCMEMSGLEFCGNASRSFGLYLAKQNRNLNKTSGNQQLRIKVSGSEKILDALANAETDYTRVAMPLPVSMDMAVGNEADEINGGIIVNLGGIIHMVLDDVVASMETFEKVKAYINERYDNPPCIGAMFYDSKTLQLVPVVYVRDVNSVYFEGSCGSGTTALAISRCMGRVNGEYSYDISQPAGVITSTVVMKGGRPEAVYIEGKVELGEQKSIDINL